MITAGSIYIISSDFEKAVGFYGKLFEKSPDARNKTRFAQFFVNGFALAIMNGRFDIEHPDEVEGRMVFTDVYDDWARIMDAENCGKVVVNIYSDDLAAEYERIKALGIGTDLTEIRYVNAQTPYWYFLLKDVDGNTIEITGKYSED